MDYWYLNAKFEPDHLIRLARDDAGAVPCVIEFLVWTFQRALIHRYVCPWLGDRNPGLNVPLGPTPTHLRFNDPLRTLHWIESGQLRPEVPVRFRPLQRCEDVFLVQVYAEDLHLCPRCGRFDLREGAFWDRYRRGVFSDAVARNLYQARRETPEFSLTPCTRPDCSTWHERFLKDVLHTSPDPERRRDAVERMVPDGSAPLPRHVNIHIADGFVYVIQSGDFVKIGKSVEVERRLKAIAAANPQKIRIVNVFHVSDMHRLERALQHRFRSRRVRREWFRLDASEIETIRKATSIEEIIESPGELDVRRDMQ